MPTKKKTEDVVVPFMKCKEVEVRKLGTRLTAEFEAELRALFVDGYKVVSLTKKSDCVRLQLAKTEDWTFTELMAEIREQLPGAELNARIDGPVRMPSPMPPTFGGFRFE